LGLLDFSLASNRELIT